MVAGGVRGRSDSLGTDKLQGRKRGRGTREGGGGRGGQLSEERGSLSSLSQSDLPAAGLLPPACLGSLFLCAGGWLEELSCVLAACLDLNMD